MKLGRYDYEIVDKFKFVLFIAVVSALVAAFIYMVMHQAGHWLGWG